jgi:hypothetical protein
MDERKRRIGLNEAVFREANERIEELNQTFATLTDELVLVCECGYANCTEKISMSSEEYDVVRKDDGVARQIAEVTDPR